MNEVDKDAWKSAWPEYESAQDHIVIMAHDHESIPGSRSGKASLHLAAFCQWLETFNYNVMATCRSKEDTGWLALCRKVRS